MKLLGIFDKIIGVVFGKMLEYEPPEEDSGISMTDFWGLDFKGYQFPILYDCAFGHVDNNLCLPFAGHVTIDTDEDFDPKMMS